MNRSHILELWYEPQPIARVAADRESGDLLLAAIDRTGDTFRSWNNVAVEADSTVTRCKFACRCVIGNRDAYLAVFTLRYQ